MKRILLIISIIVFALTGNAQIQMWLGGQTEGGGAGTGLLDQHPGAAAAYALVNLTDSWATNDVVLVRRDSDNAELGFTADELSDGTLEAWVGAGDGFVKTWYDQSGNAININIATNADQSKIVEGGVIITDNGNVSLKTPQNATSIMQIPSWTGSANTSLFFVSSFSTVGNSVKCQLKGDSNSKYVGIYHDGSTTAALDGSAGSGVYRKNGTIISPANRNEFWDEMVNSEYLLTVSADLSSWIQLNLFYAAGAVYPVNYLTAMIVYNFDQSSNYPAIETIIDSIYSIY